MFRWEGVTQSLLRIVSGLLLVCPGGMKLFGWFGGMPPGVALTPLLVAAGVIEVVGGSLILIGLFTRPVAFIVSGEMAAAYFIGHFPRGFLPIQNHGEAATLLCFILLFISARGPGFLSVDSMLARRATVGAEQGSSLRGATQAKPRSAA